MACALERSQRLAQAREVGIPRARVVVAAVLAGARLREGGGGVDRRHHRTGFRFGALPYDREGYLYNLQEAQWKAEQLASRKCVMFVTKKGGVKLELLARYFLHDQKDRVIEIYWGEKPLSVPHQTWKVIYINPDKVVLNTQALLALASTDSGQAAELINLHPPYVIASPEKAKQSPQ